MRLLFILPLVFLTFSKAWAEEEKTYDSYFPKGVKAGYLLEFDKLAEKFTRKTPKIRINHKGQLTLLTDETLYVLDKKSILPYPLPIGSSLSDYNWIKEGTLLGVKEAQLGIPSPSGLNLLFDLPDTYMEITPAGWNSFYLSGGRNNSQNHNAYLAKKGQELTHLVKTPDPITAISGDGENTFIAVGRSIFFLSPGKQPKLIYQLEFDVVSLVYTPPHGLFYASTENVGFVLKSGVGFTFLKATHARLMAHKKNLYIELPYKGILHVTPISSFEEMALKMVTDIKQKQVNYKK
ncbi:MAG: hypothetical protein OQJ97_03995 [Rhodospirillales bacterium]|nr:hypothetical protein [Rhodospirillales bacterium]